MAADPRRRPRAPASFAAAPRDAHLDGFPPLELAEAEGVDASLRIDAPRTRNALAGVDPALIARAARARRSVREARLAQRWAITLWPTPSRAQQAGMGSRDFAAFVAARCSSTATTRWRAWGELREFQAGLIERLAPAREIHIEAEGTDLR